MGEIVVLWTIAYDNIMSCSNDLKKVFWWDVEKCSKTAYNVDDLKKESGWSGLNISYNIALLWWKSVLFSSVWTDFEFSDFIISTVNLDNIYKANDLLTSRSYIISDSSWAQVSSYFLWATALGNELKLNVLSNVNYIVVSSFEVGAMKSFLSIYKKAWIKTVFAPGEQIQNMSKADLDICLWNTDILVVNSDEYEILKNKAEKNDEEMIGLFEYIIITYGVNGSKIFDKHYNMIEVPWVSNPNLKDTVWVGDAYRAGLVKWLNDWFDIEKSAKIWAVLASVSTWTTWAQNHKLSWDELKELYKDTFWDSL